MVDLRGIFSFIPEIRKPEEKKLGFNTKLKWTIIVLVSFFVLANISLFGLSENALSRFEYLAIILGTDFGINLSEYKILGEGNIKSNFVITARAASDSAQNKVKKLGGKIILPQKKEESEPAEKKE